MKKVVFTLLLKVARTLSGKGLGKIPGIWQLYRLAYKILQPKRIISITCQGNKMYVDGRDKNIVPDLLSKGAYEPFETELFKKSLKKGEVVLDIGAHIGYYTLIAAKIVGDEGKVFAFEPAPDNYALLEKNVNVNGYRNVILEQKATSDKTGKLKLYLTGNNTAMHRIYPSRYSVNSIEIDTIRLDDYFEDYSGKIDMIKIDVEGAEWSVFQGMPQILQKNRKLRIFTEFNPGSIREFGGKPEEYLKLFLDQGFKLYHINEKEENVEPISIPELLQMYTPGSRWLTNLLCVRE